MASSVTPYRGSGGVWTEGVQGGPQGRAGACLGMGADSTALLARVPRHHTDDGWAGVGKGAGALPRVGTSPGESSEIRTEGADVSRGVVPLVSFEGRAPHPVGRGRLVQRGLHRPP